MIDIKKVVETAEKEVQEENLKAATGKLKELYRRREQARKMLVNINNEIDLYITELGDGSV